MFQDVDVKVQMYGGHVRKDKKRVSFTTPDDDDSSSTASELDKMEFPPQFGGSNDSLTKPFDGYQNALKNGHVSNALSFQKRKSRDISPRNSDIGRVDHDATEEELNELKQKIHKGPGQPLSEHEITLYKDMCHVDKIRSDSNGSISSLNTSFDSSPLSPPPNTLGLPLYNTLGRRGSKDLLLDGTPDLSSIVEKHEDEVQNQEGEDSTTPRPESTSETKTNEEGTSGVQSLADELNFAESQGTKKEENNVTDMTDIDELMANINDTIAGSLQQLNIDESQATAVG